MSTSAPVWNRVSLENLCVDPITYGVVKPGSEGDVAFVRGGDIQDGRVGVESLRTITSEVSNQYRRTRLRGNEVLVSLVGNPGQVAVVPTEMAGGNIARQVGLVRLREGVNPHYVSYYLRSPEGQNELRGNTVGSVQQVINLGDLRRVELPMPSLRVQDQVVATLGALDDKIGANRRLISLIPSLIRSKVRAAITRCHQSVSVATLAKFVNGGAFTKDATGKGRMVVRIADLNGGPGPSTVYNELDVPEDKIARPGDILMSWSGSLGVYRWFRDEAIVNQHIFKVLPTGYPAWLVFERLDHVIEVFQGIAKDKATTMGHIQRGHLESTTVDVPTGEEIRRLDKEAGPLWERLLVAEAETLRLERLRDALLPELLSGRIRVPEGREEVA